MASAVLVSAVPPLMLKTAAHPEGQPIEVFDGFRRALANNRAGFFLDVPSGPFYGFNRDGAQVQQGVVRNWWRQAMMGSALAHYEGIRAFSETDQTEDLKAIGVPTLVLHGTADTLAAPSSADLIERGAAAEDLTVHRYDGLYHEVFNEPEKETVFADLERWLQDHLTTQ